MQKKERKRDRRGEEWRMEKKKKGREENTETEASGEKFMISVVGSVLKNEREDDMVGSIRKNEMNFP